MVALFIPLKKKHRLPENEWTLQNKNAIRYLTVYRQVGQSGKSFVSIADISHAIGFAASNVTSILEAFDNDFLRDGKNMSRFVDIQRVPAGLKKFAEEANKKTPMTKHWCIGKNAENLARWFVEKFSFAKTETPPLDIDETISLIEERLAYVEQLIWSDIAQNADENSRPATQTNFIAGGNAENSHAANEN